MKRVLTRARPDDSPVMPAGSRRFLLTSRAGAVRCCAIVVAAWLAGCALPGTGSSSSAGADRASEATTPSATAAVAEEMIGVFARVGELGPDRIEPRVRTRDDAVFTAALEQALTDAGYRLAAADSTQGVPIAYALQPTADGVTVTVGMRDVQVRRSYTGSLEAPVPAGPLYVRGTDAGTLRGADPIAATPAPDVEVPASATAPAPSMADGRPSGTEIGAGADGAPALDGVVARALRGLDEPDTVRNVMQVGDSNFADLFATYRTVAERIMVFPNDSMRLGEDNRTLIAAEVERFRPETDMFSVVGCSLGPTKLENGNEVLALGRANRVVEELVASGVPSSRVVDEGCWAGEASERFPSRGVVLTLRRSQGAFGS